MSGSLYVVATPIGNVEDFTERAVATLQAVDLIAAEDTRHSQPLLARFNINTPVRSYHDFSNDSVLRDLLQRLQDGQSLALISDAGTPLISDPGFRLVKSLRELGIPIVPIPGASALTAALSVAGLATDRFCFEGFLPAKSGQRQARLAELGVETRTMVFYESPHRITATLADLVAVFGAARQLFLGRELTKKFESHYFGDLAGGCSWLDQDANNRKGEFVLVVAGCDPETLAEQQLQRARGLIARLRPAFTMKEAVALACEVTGARKNALYQAVLQEDQEEKEEQ